ncbi:MAG: YkgJ family cysteine cluster protein [Chitinophagales bacterium]|nr:YkgJ family cysteine cluster protein [Chitinophagales bacterium]
MNKLNYDDFIKSKLKISPEEIEKQLNHTKINLSKLQASFDQIEESFDCLSCAQCCKQISPILYPEDFEPIAKHFPKENIFDTLIEIDQEGDFVFRSQPCPLLETCNGKCKIYENKPMSCSDFPHLYNVSEYFDYDALIQNISICPIVYFTSVDYLA